ncbi:ABC transporter substrate-binding protein [Rathayibacter rathayi]|uniref:Thiamine pyrimidine synthase n=1 Tax=Rathayibacter rathayi TaxID=33887 RepID=A0ABD6WAH6_RATRA|nr:ABC transporter substrate-binding protein [Rathayibacter rathayi]PPF15108.1 ABC transporter substrate-binding protein [Rathayibacter rathayi]PPF25027.1 ABC transporter substrate-binding protein [Rathayibacter rathayi]PPG15187.1 ABC transporter substrate-binding protein [Rathayibacter rathayi]PPG46297.1 ABC transporter substrate-binding protein [Rathayibacter rathayi]PPG97413.1 ABC transporter substrate-binding protein [Rathayibacter rathayi]
MNRPIRITLTTTAAFVAVGLALTGCTTSGSGSDSDSDSGGLTPVTLQLQWVAQAQFAGYYAALDQGYYADEGLDVTIAEGGGDIVPQDVLASGDADYAISWVPKVLGSIEQGAEITDVAQIFERSATTQISFKDNGISSPADLAGRSVGSWGHGNEWELFAGLQKDGVALEDISLVQQQFDMNGFLAGDIDAAQAMTYNEYAQVLETVNPVTGALFQPDDLNVISWNDVGTAMLQDAIWADAARLSDDAYAQQTVAFIKASIKGWIFAKDDPQQAADIVTAAGSTLGTSHQLWMTNEVNKLIWPSTDGIGMVDEAAWQQTVGIAKSTKNETGATIISADPPATAYSNEYVEKALSELADEGVDTSGADYAPIDVTPRAGGA